MAQEAIELFEKLQTKTSSPKKRKAEKDAEPAAAGEGEGAGAGVVSTHIPMDMDARSLSRRMFVVFESSAQVRVVLLVLAHARQGTAGRARGDPTHLFCCRAWPRRSPALRLAGKAHCYHYH